MPVYVGTDANISYQGDAARREPERATPGPSSRPAAQAGQRTPPRMPQPTPPPTPGSTSRRAAGRPTSSGRSRRRRLRPRRRSRCRRRAPECDAGEVSVAALRRGAVPSDGTTHDPPRLRSRLTDARRRAAADRSWSGRPPRRGSRAARSRSASIPSVAAVVVGPRPSSEAAREWPSARIDGKPASSSSSRLAGPLRDPRDRRDHAARHRAGPRDAGLRADRDARRRR